MGQFRKRKKGSPSISTASLPDIIFILLFFFMVTTKVRKTDLKVEAKLPKISQLQKLDETLEQVDIYIGVPVDEETFGTEPVIQVNDKFITSDQLRQFISEEIAKLPITKRSKNNLVISLKVDEEVQMGLVTDVKQELRDMGVLKVNYTSAKKTDI